MSKQAPDSVSEGTNQRLIWLALGQMCRLFRVNTGRAWISSLGPKGVERMANGSVLIHAARPVSLGYGLPNGDPLKGTPDLNGWTSIEVTPEMVGHRIAVHTAIETKRPHGGRVSKEQANHVNQVRLSGGIAGVASSENEALAIINDWRQEFSRKLI